MLCLFITITSIHDCSVNWPALNQPFRGDIVVQFKLTAIPRYVLMTVIQKNMLIHMSGTAFCNGWSINDESKLNLDNNLEILVLHLYLYNQV